MKKFINNNDDFLKESLTGFGKAHSDIINVNLDPSFVSRKNKTKNGKVSLISGGGSGHEPMHGGFVGHGMLDAACPGFVFSAPTPDQMQAAAEHVDSGAGVLFIVKNYSGDIMNFQMGAEMYSGKNDSIVTNDDVAVEDSTFTTGRRGVAATVLVEKIVGSLAEHGGSLEECKKHKIDAKSVKKEISDILESVYEKDYVKISEGSNVGGNLKKHLKALDKKMKEAASNLEFEEAAKIRDEIRKLESTELEITLNPKIRQYDVKNKLYPKGRSTMGMPGTKVTKKRDKKWKHGK